MVTNSSQPSNEDLAWFLDRMIHDLREPLRSVHSYSELLSENPPAPAADLARGEILSGAVRIRSLVDALAGYALALRPSEGPASLGLAMNMALTALDRDVRETGATVSGDGLPRVALSLERAEQLLEILIANSLRFRGDRAPEVSIAAAASDPGWWLVTVRDNGIGMQPDECESVFRPFMRLHGRKFGGVGLGLTAARCIVENHGGKIWIESKPGEGCVCHLTLPAAG